MGYYDEMMKAAGKTVAKKTDHSVGSSNYSHPMAGNTGFTSPSTNQGSTVINNNSLGNQYTANEPTVGYGDNQVDPGFVGALMTQEAAGGAGNVNWANEQDNWAANTQSAQQAMGGGSNNVASTPITQVTNQSGGKPLENFTWTPPGGEGDGGSEGDGNEGDGNEGEGEGDGETQTEEEIITSLLDDLFK